MQLLSQPPESTTPQTTIPILNQRTKIVATIGPASRNPDVLRQMVRAGMSVARLNFSHGSYDDHAQTVKMLRDLSIEMDTPIALLQDLQGPKIRVCQLPNDAITLEDGASLNLVPEDQLSGQPNTIAIDYPHLAEEAKSGTRILLDDGLLEIEVQAVDGATVQCKVIRGGLLKSRKGVNVPSLSLRLPSMTEKDKEDLKFGLSQGVDWVALSFVRQAEDVRELRAFLTEQGAADTAVLAKIEKPQAVDNIYEIVKECNAIMVARGDMGVEIEPEKVPMIQKRIIQACNQRGIPVITATQMLESMIKNARPTRAEASDVANAILDGTDAVMLSAESAVGDYPVEAVEMMARIARQVEPTMHPPNFPPGEDDEVHAITEALNTIDKTLDLRCIVAATFSGYTAYLASAERPRAYIVAVTPEPKIYQRLNLAWGVRPILLSHTFTTIEEMVQHIEDSLLQRNLVAPGDRILILGGSPLQATQRTNLLKLQTIGFH